MKIVVIGLGSMGRRRIRLVRGLYPKAMVVGVDLATDRRTKAEAELGIPTCASLDEAVADYGVKVALVCTSPLSHGSIVLSCLRAGLHVFTELNLVTDWYDEALALAAKKRKKLFVSSTFLYRRETQYVAKAVAHKRVNYIYHSGQYLPDWHPWESYKNFFVANRRTNACREILAIELPWLVRAFGAIESVQVMADRNSSLDLDFNDNYIVTIRHKNGNKGVFCQDVIARKGLRRLEVYSEKLHLFWEGTPQSLSTYDFKRRELVPVLLYDDIVQDASYNVNIIENMYRDELRAFFAYVASGVRPPYTFKDDKETLELVDRIEGVKA